MFCPQDIMSKDVLFQDFFTWDVLFQDILFEYLNMSRIL